jgi:hypothetical protein
LNDYDGVNIGRVWDTELKIFLFCERLLRNIWKRGLSLNSQTLQRFNNEVTITRNAIVPLAIGLLLGITFFLL